ncbi:hypothetical protein VTI74DRAFT_7816 [Chaetomium olivicolor]
MNVPKRLRNRGGDATGIFVLQLAAFGYGLEGKARELADISEFLSSEISQVHIRDSSAHVTGGYNGQLSTLQWAHPASQRPTSHHFSAARRSRDKGVTSGCHQGLIGEQEAAITLTKARFWGSRRADFRPFQLGWNSGAPQN